MRKKTKKMEWARKKAETLQQKRWLWRWNIFIVDCILELYFEVVRWWTWRAHQWKHTHTIEKNLRWRVNNATMYIHLKSLRSMCHLLVFIFTNCLLFAVWMSEAAIHLSIFVCFFFIDLCFLKHATWKQRADTKNSKYFLFGNVIAVSSMTGCGKNTLKPSFNFFFRIRSGWIMLKSLIETVRSKIRQIEIWFKRCYALCLTNTIVLCFLWSFHHFKIAICVSIFPLDFHFYIERLPNDFGNESKS